MELRRRGRRGSRRSAPRSSWRRSRASAPWTATGAAPCCQRPPTHWERAGWEPGGALWHSLHQASVFTPPGATQSAFQRRENARPDTPVLVRRTFRALLSRRSTASPWRLGRGAAAAAGAVRAAPRGRGRLRALREANVDPSPATHAILIVLKVGERWLKTVLRHFR